MRKSLWGGEGGRRRGRGGEEREREMGEEKREATRVPFELRSHSNSACTDPPRLLSRAVFFAHGVRYRAGRVGDETKNRIEAKSELGRRSRQIDQKLDILTSAPHISEHMDQI